MPGKKQLWLLAGANGAGKTTFYNIYLASKGVKFINADLIAKQIAPDEPEARSYEAAAIAAKLRSSYLRKGLSFCFETVFSHPSKIDFVAEAKSLGYEIILVYIHLQSPELNLARIAQRVSEGGHSVPEEKVLSRIPRTMGYIHDVLPLIDIARMYDNSSRETPFVSVAELRDGRLKKFIDPLPDWAGEMLAVYM
jgi:predicted ABC-type ATPase